MLSVGLTGNIASGKSTVVRIWRRLGARVIDADRLARLAVAPGTPGLRNVVEEFGEEILGPEGELDREELGRRVFADPDARRRLEAIVHPEVGRLRREEERRIAGEVEASGESGVVLVHDIPLLFEAGLSVDFDVVVLIDAPREERLRRLVEKRGLDPEQARQRIDAQQPAEEKRRAADLVIENDGTLDELERRATDAWRTLRERAENK